MKKFVFTLLAATALCSASATELVRLPYAMASAAEKEMSGCDTIYTMPTANAEFPGGMDALYDFYFRNLPKEYEMVMSMSPNIILLKAFINDKGEIANAKVLRSFNPAYSDAVVSVTEKLPAFKPAVYKGHDVCSYRIIKLYFK